MNVLIIETLARWQSAGCLFFQRTHQRQNEIFSPGTSYHLHTHRQPSIPRN